MYMNRLKPVTAVAVVLLSLTTLANADVLKTVKDRGALNCGVSEGLYGFSARDKDGNWSGFDVDLCRAIAAAIFNDSSKVNFTPLESSHQFEALQSGSIDVLSRNTTWTMSREIELGLSFTATNYYDGQGFLVRRSMNKETALDLDGAKRCVQTGTTTELNLVDYFRANKMKYEVLLHLPRRLQLKATIPERATFSLQTCRSSLPSGYCFRSPMSTSFCRTSSPRNHLARWYARTICNGLTS